MMQKYLRFLRTQPMPPSRLAKTARYVPRTSRQRCCLASRQKRCSIGPAIRLRSLQRACRKERRYYARDQGPLPWRSSGRGSTRQLQSRKIRAVVTLCSETVNERAPEITYRHLPILDSRPISQHRLHQVLNAIAESIRTGSVLIHCAAGASRTPTIAAAYLHHIGWRAFPQALAYLARMRPEIGPSPVLVESVIRHPPPFVRVR